MRLSDNDFSEAIGNLYARVSTYWQKNSSDLLDGRCGYSIFGSKPYPNARLLIVGLNPGFSEQDANGDAHVDCVPTASQLLEDDRSPFKMALRQLFDFNGGAELLNEAVATNLLLFKSNRMKGDHELSWSQVPKGIRRQAEDFSRREFDYVLDLLKPQQILVVGLRAADLIMNRTRLEGPPPLYRQKRSGHRLIIHGSTSGIPAVGISHITGSRISTKDKARMTEWLARYFAEHS